MMKVLLTTCLLLTLIYPVASLICYQCVGNRRTCNNPEEIECAEDEDSCVSLAVSLELYNDTFNFATKTCANSNHCRPGIYRTTEETGFSLASNLHCCDSDLCNGEHNQKPPTLNLPPNGFECPSCFDLDTDHCQADDTVACLGDEIECIYIGLAVKTPGDVDVAMAFRSCGTPGFCQIPRGTQDAEGGFVNANFTHVKCSNAQRIIYQQAELNSEG